MDTQGTRRIHAFDGWRHAAVFIDPFLFDPLHKHALAWETMPSVVHKKLLRSPREQVHEDQMPYVLWMPLNSDTRALLHDLQDIARAEANWIPTEGEARTQPRTVTGFMAGALVDQGADKLRIVLGRMRLVMDSAGRQRIFRFWDPRVMQHLALRGARPQAIDLAASLHPQDGAMSWLYFDSLGRPARHDIAGGAWTSDTDFPRNLQLDERMEGELKRWGTLNKALLHALAQDARQFAALDMAKIFERILAPNLAPFESMSGLDEDDKAALAFIRHATGRAFEHDETVMREVFVRKKQGSGAASFMQDLDYFLARDSFEADPTSSSAEKNGHS
ncbi:DUF4123 domain-containing protein [Variovorax sp. RKNM96]|uniref:DUF4123 domain-containing protein n=1 Tax=Variovorax sp. RKNM96 TaxID=2681552 RepID=UPI00197EBDE6|nr:DUF4123 domain-containing protein [Variovorax sp. RKNM96]QSI33705.1 DUF4123 domain-containing protein [Variovorax sp. RKNM96]